MLMNLMPPVAVAPAAAASPAPNPGSAPPDAAAPPSFARLLGAASDAQASATPQPQAPGAEASDAHAAPATAPVESAREPPTATPSDGHAAPATTGRPGAAHSPAPLRGGQRGEVPRTDGKAARGPLPQTDAASGRSGSPADRPSNSAASDAASPAGDSAPPTNTAASTAPDASALLASLAAAPRPVPAAQPAATPATGSALAGELERGKLNLGSSVPARPGAPGLATDGLAAEHSSPAAASDSSAWRNELQVATAVLAPTAPAAPAVAAAASPPGAAAPATTDGATPSAQLSAHPSSAEFGPQLGAQVTTFVRDGVQHARLELNPSTMGPVTVQIQLEGNAAQVHLAADHAQTRQALEQAMPALATSLREAGLTLSGGGVFEQPRQPQPGQPDAPTALGSRVDAPDASAAPALVTPALRRRGVVDLVA